MPRHTNGADYGLRSAHRPVDRDDKGARMFARLEREADRRQVEVKPPAPTIHVPTRSIEEEARARIKAGSAGPKTSKAKVEPPAPTSINCEICGGLIENPAAGQRFDSRECKTKARLARQEAARKAALAPAHHHLPAPA